MNKGKDFEELVTLVESAVHNLPGVEVLHDVKLPTKYGGKRQIDIVLKENRGRFTYVTIIECKNTNCKSKEACFSQSPMIPKNNKYIGKEG